MKLRQISHKKAELLEIGDLILANDAIDAATREILEAIIERLWNQPDEDGLSSRISESEHDLLIAALALTELEAEEEIRLIQEEQESITKKIQELHLEVKDLQKEDDAVQVEELKKNLGT